MPMPKAGPRDVAGRGRARRGSMRCVAAAAAYFEAQLAAPAGQEARRYLDKRGLTPGRHRTLPAGLRAQQQVGAEGASGQGRLLDGRDDRVGHADRRRRHPGALRPLPPPHHVSHRRRQGPRHRLRRAGARSRCAGEISELAGNAALPQGRTCCSTPTTRAAAAHDKSQIIVVEGYMDVIALSEAGFPQTVAPLGTALTEDQLKLLWRMAPEPILCFDGDAAGRRAAFRAVETALPHLQAGPQRAVRVPARRARSRRSRPPARARAPSRTFWPRRRGRCSTS